MSKNPEKVKIEKRGTQGKREVKVGVINRESTEPIAKEKLMEEASRGIEKDLIIGAQKGIEYLKKKRESFSFDDRVEEIKNFVKRESGFPPFSKKEIRDFFSELSPDQLKEILGEEEFQIASNLILEINFLLLQMAANGIDIAKVQKIYQEGDKETLPYRISQGLILLTLGRYELGILFGDAYSIAQKAMPNFSPREKAKFHRAWQETLDFYKIENNKWNTHLEEPQREREEMPVEIKGFEKFDFPEIKGNEIVKLALKVFPPKSFSLNIKSVEYIDETRSMLSEYGMEGYAGAQLSDTGGRETISFFKSSNKLGEKEKWDYLGELVFNLIHEWAHSLDPRLCDQEDLPLLEQLKIVEEWEKVRAEEPPFSAYVRKIKNPDKKREDTLKSQEDWAESISLFLGISAFLEKIAPKRYQFFKDHFKKCFPELDSEQSSKTRRKYQCLIDALGIGNKNLINKSLKEI